MEISQILKIMGVVVSFYHLIDMEVIVNDRIYKGSEISFKNDLFFLDGSSFRKVGKDVVLVYKEVNIDLFLFIDSIKKVLKKIKFPDVEVVILKESDAMSVSFLNSYDNVEKIVIYVGADLFLFFTLEEILIFVCHELGHVEDQKYIYKVEKKLSLISNFLKIFCSFFLGAGVWFLMIEASFGEKVFWLMALIFSQLIIYTLYQLYYFSLLKKKEYNADIFAANLIGDHKKVALAFVKLSKVVGEEEDEGEGFFSTHPSLSERIKYLNKYFWYKKLFFWRN